MLGVSSPGRSWCEHKEFGSHQAPAREIDAVLSDRDGYARTREDLIKSSAAFSWKVRVKDLHAAEHEPTIIFAEHRLDNHVIRLGEDSDADLMVTAAHLHRGGRFIKDRPITIMPKSRNGIH